MAKKLVFANNPLLAGPAFSEREKGIIPYREVAVTAIERDPNQPRVIFEDEKIEELAESIRTYGVLTPVLVRPSKQPAKYILVAGERRLKAAVKAGLKTVPAIVDQEKDDTGERTLAIQLVENIQRENLTPLEKAHAIGALKESFSLSVREVAKRIGISKSMVQRSLDILDLPDDLLNALRQGAPESKILLLAKIEDSSLRAKYLDDLDSITRDEISDRVVHKETLVKPKSSKKKKALSPEDRRITEEIQRSLGLKVGLIRSGSESGRISVEFYSDQDLQEIFRKLIAE